MLKIAMDKIDQFLATDNSGFEQSRQRAVLKTFLKTRSRVEEVVFKALKDLAPDTLDDHDLFTLSNFIRWEAQEYFADNPLPEHHGVFGTGGDIQHTINISTISSIVAAHYHTTINVVKLGTGAVTGKFGSAEVADTARGL